MMTQSMGSQVCTEVQLQCGSRILSLAQPRIMGILNVTPDSFSDGGRYLNSDHALKQAEAMLAAGADIIDIGGESTRPGAAAVSEQQELDRILPVLNAIVTNLDVIVSVDTSKAKVMLEVAAAGAGLLNDVRALREPGAQAAAIQTQLPVCLMHMQGQPRTMQSDPSYSDVVAEVGEFLRGRVDACAAAGLDKGRLLIDPGFGFGKTLMHNLLLIENLNAFCSIAPVLVGLSRKRMLGEILGDTQVDRTTASVVAALQCVRHGACIVRVHDVAETAQALAVHQAVENHHHFEAAPVAEMNANV